MGVHPWASDRGVERAVVLSLQSLRSVGIAWPVGRPARTGRTTIGKYVARRRWTMTDKESYVESESDVGGTLGAPWKAEASPTTFLIPMWRHRYLVCFPGHCVVPQGSRLLINECSWASSGDRSNPARSPPPPGTSWRRAIRFPHSGLLRRVALTGTLSRFRPVHPAWPESDCGATSHRNIHRDRAAHRAMQPGHRRCLRRTGTRRFRDRPPP